MATTRPDDHICATQAVCFQCFKAGMERVRARRDAGRSAPCRSRKRRGNCHPAPSPSASRSRASQERATCYVLSATCLTCYVLCVRRSCHVLVMRATQDRDRTSQASRARRTRPIARGPSHAAHRTWPVHIARARGTSTSHAARGTSTSHSALSTSGTLHSAPEHVARFSACA